MFEINTKRAPIYRNKLNDHYLFLTKMSIDYDRSMMMNCFFLYIYFEKSGIKKKRETDIHRSERIMCEIHAHYIKNKTKQNEI